MPQRRITKLLKEGQPSLPESGVLSEVETFFKVRAFVKEIGGVEKLRAYLELVEKDAAEKP